MDEREYLEVAEIIDKHLDQRLKGQRAVEFETAELVAKRLTAWAKLFGFIVGIPLVLFVAIFMILGIREYSDLREKAGTVRKEIEDHKTAIETKVGDFEFQLARRHEQLEKFDQVLARVDRLQNRLSQVELKVSVAPDLEMTDADRQHLVDSFSNFHAYFGTIGYQPSGDVKLQIVNSETVGPTNQNQAVRYDAAENTIVISSAAMTNLDVAMQQYSAYVLSAIMHAAMRDLMPSAQGPASQPGDETAKIRQALELSIALSFYFTCSFKNNDRFDFGPARTLMLDSRLVRADNTAAMEPITRSHAISVLLWDLRSEGDREKTDPLVLKTWRDLQPDHLSGDPALSFLQRLLTGLEAAGDSGLVERYRRRLENRGLAL